MPAGHLSIDGASAKSAPFGGGNTAEGSLDGTLTTRFGQCRVPCSLLELAGAYPGLGCGKNRQGCWLLALLEVAAAALLEWAAILSCTHFRKCKLLFVWRFHGSKRISDL